jgi:adenylate kinase
MDIILFGMQGSGKGTQGAFLAQKFNLKIFDTGKELRNLIQKESPLAKKVKEIMHAGKLVSNDIVMELIENFINDNKNYGILFDGIPRNKDQEKSFNKLIAKYDRKLKGIYIALTENEAIKRLLGRRVCEKCKTIYPIAYQKNECEKCEGKLITRADDNLEAIKTRLHTFNTETLPIIENYEKAKILNRINGEQSIAKVTEDISKII